MSDGQLARDYEAKDAAYYGNPRADYVAALPQDSSARIIELGCGDGATGAMAFDARKCREYVGIEMFEPMARQAARRLSRVLMGNIETMELPFAPSSFDALIMSEVLEHLVDPYTTVKRLASLVRPGGIVLASSPNVSHHGVIRRLMLGHFDYAESGVMDRTHLRWFTPSSFRDMFEEAGVTVDHVGPLHPMRRRDYALSRVLPGRFSHLAWYQINLHGHIEDR